MLGRRTGAFRRWPSGCRHVAPVALGSASSTRRSTRSRSGAGNTTGATRSACWPNGLESFFFDGRSRVKASIWTAAVYALLASSFASVAFGASVSTSANCEASRSPGFRPQPAPRGPCVVGIYPLFGVPGPQLPAAVGADITVRVSGTVFFNLNFLYGLGGDPGTPGISNPPSTLMGFGSANINYFWGLNASFLISSIPYRHQRDVRSADL